MTATQKLTYGLKTFASDVAQGFMEVTHNGFALLGLLVMLIGLAFIYMLSNTYKDSNWPACSLDQAPTGLGAGLADQAPGCLSTHIYSVGRNPRLA